MMVVVGMQTMILNKKKNQQRQLGSPNWWWLDAHNHNNDATRRSPWLQSTLSELDEKTTAMLKLIEADADSFAQRAEMYYKKRTDLIGVVEEFYRMHRSLAERFDQLKSDSATRLLMGSPFSCDRQVPLKKSLSLSPGTYESYDACSDTSDDHEDNPESEVEDPEEDSGTEPTSPKEESRGKLVAALDEVALTRADVNDEIGKLKEEVERLKEENKMQRDEIACREEQKAEEMTRELTVSMEEIKRPKEVNKMREATPSQKIQAPANLGKSGNPIEHGSVQGGGFLRRMFPKSSKKSKVTSALSLIRL